MSFVRGHVRSCRKREERRVVLEPLLNGGKLCEFGCGRPARFILKIGKVCCEKDVSSCPEMRRKNRESHKGKCPNWKNGHPKGNKGNIGSTPWTGKKFEDFFGVDRAKEIGKKIRDSLTGRHWEASTPEIGQQRRVKISDTARRNGISGGYRIGCGRGKKGRYKGIWCDSSWELAWIMFHLDNGILFERNKDRFEYQWEGETHRYLPDFKMPDGSYVEIKAWLDDKGRAKLTACPGVKVLMKKEMEPFIQYVVGKYGKDFVGLYEE